MSTSTKEQLLPIAQRVAADMNIVLSNAELAAEISAANDSLRELMNCVNRPDRQKQSNSTILVPPSF